MNVGIRVPKRDFRESLRDIRGHSEMNVGIRVLERAFRESLRNNIYCSGLIYAYVRDRDLVEVESLPSIVTKDPEEAYRRSSFYDNYLIKT